VLFEVSNRGRKGLLGMFDRAAGSLDPKADKEFGDRFLLEQGYTLVWLGWQFDVPTDPTLMRLNAPVIKGVTGLVRAEFIPDKKIHSSSLADRSHVPYAVANPADPSLQLTVRDRADGPRRALPRSSWQFAREVDGKPVPDTGSVYSAAGFEAGKIYEIVYKAQDPAVVGLGPTAIRELISYLKYDGGPMLLGDQRRFIKRAIAFGTSQSGRFLRTFLYYGFNADEKNRKVFDGVWAHVAGAGRGSFNHRFAQPSRDGHPFLNTFFPTDIYPFSDVAQTDPETGATAGILDRAEKAGVTPKIFYTNGSYEYWGRSASLVHTSLDGRADAPLPKDTRVYLLAGTQHGAGSFPPSRSSNTRNLANTNDYRWAMRALLVAMNRWITDGTAPPESQRPLVGKDQLVGLTAVQFPKIPGIDFPTRMQRAWRADYGPEFLTKGIVTQEPPAVGKPFATMVPQVDTDGNETSGIRAADVRVPLGTYTGWNLRDPKIGAPEELFSMVGSFVPFARTKAERQKARDPRPSIEERYRGREDYMTKVNAALKDLVASGHVLESDVPAITKSAGERWDYLTKAN
jgi:alpha/beta hydrolase family protein